MKQKIIEILNMLEVLLSDLMNEKQNLDDKIKNVETKINNIENLKKKLLETLQNIGE